MATVSAIKTYQLDDLIKLCEQYEQAKQITKQLRSKIRDVRSTNVQCGVLPLGFVQTRIRMQFEHNNRRPFNEIFPLEDGRIGSIVTVAKELGFLLRGYLHPALFKQSQPRERFDLHMIPFDVLSENTPYFREGMDLAAFPKQEATDVYLAAEDDEKLGLKWLIATDSIFVQ